MLQCKYNEVFEVIERIIDKESEKIKYYVDKGIIIFFVESDNSN